MSRQHVIALLGEPDARYIVEDLHTDPRESGEWCWTQQVTREFAGPPLVEYWAYRHDSTGSAVHSLMIGIDAQGLVQTVGRGNAH